jgi:hypothetical protein
VHFCSERLMRVCFYSEQSVQAALDLLALISFLRGEPCCAGLFLTVNSVTLRMVFPRVLFPL